MKTPISVYLNYQKVAERAILPLQHRAYSISVCLHLIVVLCKCVILQNCIKAVLHISPILSLPESEPHWVIIQQVEQNIKGHSVPIKNLYYHQKKEILLLNEGVFHIWNDSEYFPCVIRKMCFPHKNNIDQCFFTSCWRVSSLFITLYETLPEFGVLII